MNRFTLQIILSLNFLIVSCGKEGRNTSTGNPLVALKLSGFSEIIQSQDISVSNVSSLTLCFKRLRFRAVDDSSTDIDLEIGQVTLNPSGTDLTSVEIPTGIYERIELDLQKDCLGSNEPSVIIDNDNDGGTPFETDDRMTIRFEGETLVSSNQTLTLFIGNLISAADSINDADDIKDRFEDAGATGGFQ